MTNMQSIAAMLITFGVGVVIGIRVCASTGGPQLRADPGGELFEGKVYARTASTGEKEADLNLHAGAAFSPRVYVSITVDADDPAAKRFAEHVEKKRKFLVRVEAAR